VKILCYAEFTRMFAFYLHRNFHLHRSIFSLDISIKEKAKYIFHATTILLFYILQKYFTKGAYFSRVITTPDFWAIY
jgi:hypothetical protein